jgi:hypothetical protein
MDIGSELEYKKPDIWRGGLWIRSTVWTVSLAGLFTMRWGISFGNFS